MASSSVHEAPSTGTTPAPHEQTKWRLPFEAVLKAILRDYAGQEEKIRDGMAKGMRGLFERPYEAELGRLRAARGGSSSGSASEPYASAESLSVEDAQRVIFFPKLSDMQYYVDALALDTPEATNRREKLMKIKMVSVFYTLHRRDGCLVDRFMHCGGLQSLVELVADENPVVQSEAVELLMEMLSPQMQLGRPQGVSLRQAHLSHQIWKCLRSQSFWKNFAQVIAEPAERFPNSHEHSVRILAGAVGWLRPEEGAMPATIAPPDVSEAAEALQAYLDRPAAIRPDIRGVTEDLLAELLGIPVVCEDPLPDGAERREALAALFTDEAVAREDRAHAWQALKRLGGEAFKAGLIWPAEAAYSLAISEGAEALPQVEVATIHSNRALVLLKAGHSAEAAEAAAAALLLEPRNAKAAFRRAQGLMETLASAPTRRPSDDLASVAAAHSEAERIAAEAVKAAELASSLEPKDAKVAELLERARAKLEELSVTAREAQAAAAAVAPKSVTAGAAEMAQVGEVALGEMD